MISFSRNMGWITDRFPWPNQQLTSKMQKIFKSCYAKLDNHLWKWPHCRNLNDYELMKILYYSKNTLWNIKRWHYDKTIFLLPKTTFRPIPLFTLCIMVGETCTSEKSIKCTYPCQDINLKMIGETNVMVYPIIIQ